MADEKKTTVIIYVQFKSNINVGGTFSEIENWTRKRHGKELQLEEKGNWVILTTSTGRVRVPMTNVGFIQEGEE